MVDPERLVDVAEMLATGLMRSLVFVHISDLHFRAGDSPLAAREAALRDKLLDDVQEVVPLGRGELEAVLLTGDIARSGQRDEYIVARTWLDQLCGLLGIHTTKTLTVPGNHDIDWSRLNAERLSTNEDLRTCDVRLLDGKIDALLQDPELVLAPLEPYQEFAAGYACDIEKCLAWELPSIDLGGGYSLAIRGANSVINSDRGDAEGTMAVQLNQLLAKSEPGVVRLLMLHHSPFFWHRSNPTPAECGHNVVLYGHTHEQEHHFDGPRCLEVTAGAVHPEEHEFFVPGYNVIEISIDEDNLGPDAAHARVRIWHREFSREHQRFLDSGPDPTIDERIEIPVARDAGAPGGGAAAGGSTAGAGGAEVQPPLEDSGGFPDQMRIVLGAYEALGSGNRLRALRRLGIPVDAVVTLPPHRQIREVAKRIVNEGLVEAFLALVEELDI